MIKFDKLFQLLRERGIGQNKFCSMYDISHGQLERLRKNQNVETFTLNRIMNVLDLDSLDEICTYEKDNCAGPPGSGRLHNQ